LVARTLPRYPPFPYTTLFRSHFVRHQIVHLMIRHANLPISCRASRPAFRGAKSPLARRKSSAANGLKRYLKPALQTRITEAVLRSEEHTSELQSLAYLVCRLL